MRLEIAWSRPDSTDYIVEKCVQEEPEVYVLLMNLNGAGQMIAIFCKN